MGALMTYTFQVFYPVDGNERGASVIHVDGRDLADVMANARRDVAKIKGAKLGACIPGAHVRVP